MLTLALDTTTAAGSVALTRDERLLEVSAIDPSQPIATRVPADLMALLDRHGVSLADIQLVAVATGPGSFTGLRIGIAAMQGLSLANAIPLIGISSFDALASLAPVDANVVVWIDAWRGEVYGAAYGRVDDLGRPEIVEPTVAAPEELLRAAVSLDLRKAAFIGDGAVKYRDLVPGRLIEPTPLIAGSIARIASARAMQGKAPPPHAIRPLYVRRPDALLAREKASG